MKRRQLLCALLLLAISCVARVDARRRQQTESASAKANPSAKQGRRKQKSKEVVSPAAPGDNSDEDEIPEVHYLFEMIGKEIYKFVDCPKYRFYIYMMGYNLPQEREAIIFTESVCNVLYGISIFVGFLFFARGPMLLWTLCTLYVGPAFILLLMGAHVLMLAAFAMYPVSSVLVIWLWFFLTSQVAQVVGLQLGLDHDGDGDVDYLDLLHFLASTKVGKKIGLHLLHDKINRLSMDPFLAIHRRLDQITKKMDKESELLNKSIKNGSITVSPVAARTRSRDGQRDDIEPTSEIIKGKEE